MSKKGQPIKKRKPWVEVAAKDTNEVVRYEPVGACYKKMGCLCIELPEVRDEDGDMVTRKIPWGNIAWWDDPHKPHRGTRKVRRKAKK